MPFTGPNESTPYYRPVAPEVPVAPRSQPIENLGGTLLSAMVQRAIARERAGLDQQQILQRGDIAARQLQFDREQLAQQHDLTIRGQNIQNQNVLLDYDIANRNLEINQDYKDAQVQHLDALTGLAKSQTNAYGTALQRNIAFAKKQAELIDQAGKDAEELGLYDPKFQTEHPMQYAKNAMGYEQLYGSTTEPRLKATVKMFMDKATESKVTLDGKQYPWAQVVRDITDNPDSPFLRQLENAGFFDTKTSPETVKSGGVSVPKQVTKTPKAPLRKILEDAKAANFGELKNIKPRSDPFAPRNATEAIAQGTLDLGASPPPNPSGTRAGQLNPGAALPPPEKSPAETEAEYVKQKIAADPENADQYKALFLQRNPGRNDLLGQ